MQPHHPQVIEPQAADFVQAQNLHRGWRRFRLKHFFLADSVQLADGGVAGDGLTGGVECRKFVQALAPGLDPAPPASSAVAAGRFVSISGGAGQDSMPPLAGAGLAR